VKEMKVRRERKEIKEKEIEHCKEVEVEIDKSRGQSHLLK
jgi:hypothetical protein